MVLMALLLSCHEIPCVSGTDVLSPWFTEGGLTWNRQRLSSGRGRFRFFLGSDCSVALPSLLSLFACDSALSTPFGKSRIILLLPGIVVASLGSLSARRICESRWLRGRRYWRRN